MATAMTCLIASVAACGADRAVGGNGDRERSENPRLTRQDSGVEAQLIGLDAVDRETVWVAGRQGVVARSVDGGATWEVVAVPDADSLQFRDVHAVDEETAWVLSIGEGDASRIYKTDDGGESWSLRFVNDEPEAFFDCFGFWDSDHGIAFSDAVDGAFVLIETVDGETWRSVRPERLPPASEGEGSFAASGTCLITVGDSTAMFGTGAGEAARVIISRDRGRTWAEADTPIVDGTSTSGITSLTFLDADRGAVFGGEISEPEAFADVAAVTTDGGRTWRLAGRPTFPGAVYGAAYVPGAPTPTIVAAGPGGMSYSRDNGATWAPLDSLEHWSVTFGGSTTGWAVGPDGRVTRIDF